VNTSEGVAVASTLIPSKRTTEIRITRGVFFAVIEYKVIGFSEYEDSVLRGIGRDNKFLTLWGRGRE
jgi:hypothetical protein